MTNGAGQMRLDEKGLEAATKRICCPNGCCEPHGSGCISYQVKDVTGDAIRAYLESCGTVSVEIIGKAG